MPKLYRYLISRPFQPYVTFWVPISYIDHQYRPNEIRYVLGIPQDYIVYFPLRIFTAESPHSYSLFSYDTRWSPINCDIVEL